jgi:protein NRD1
VGFGPTQCANYQTGMSTIPLDLLTDADRKWLLTAEYGGTGGQPIATGMVVEEPDIEIGAGPSSKGKHRTNLRLDYQADLLPAIHRRGGGAVGRGGFRGNRNGHGGMDNQVQDRWKNKPSRPDTMETQAIVAPPPVPGFGAPIPGFPNFR